MGKAEMYLIDKCQAGKMKYTIIHAGAGVGFGFWSWGLGYVRDLGFRGWGLEVQGFGVKGLGV